MVRLCCLVYRANNRGHVDHRPVGCTDLLGLTERYSHGSELRVAQHKASSSIEEDTVRVWADKYVKIPREKPIRNGFWWMLLLCGKKVEDVSTPSFGKRSERWRRNCFLLMEVKLWCGIAQKG
jgi:hypothetical protein